jgi:catechol 2,3-dioxygenase-like lactoylglutathione lyase family enzyme
MSTLPRILGHISIGVRDCDVSEAFYTAVLAPLGLHLVYKSKAERTPRTLGYGPDEDHEYVNIFEYGDEAHPPGPGCHLAFNAPSREAVEEFHAAGVRSGGASNGEPGLRQHYGPNYFAAFVVDPDGWRLEAVCKEAD